MRYAILRAALLVCCGFLLYAASAAGLTPAKPVQPPEPQPGEAVKDYRGRLVDFYHSHEAPLTPPSADEPTDEVEEAVAKKTTDAAAPDGFADRVNESISDFLPLFQFAVNTISTSDDKKSVTAKFNRINVGSVVAALSGTVAEPELFPQLAEAIVEPARDAQSKSFLEGVDDFSDITAAAEVSFVSRPGGGWATRRKLFGRDAQTYKNLIGEYLVAAWDQIPAEDKAEADRREVMLLAFTRKLRDLNSSEPMGVTFQQIRDAIRDGTLTDFDLGAYQKLLADAARAEANLHRQISETKIAALPALVDNQPQIVLKLAHRSSDDLTGPDSTVASLNYEMGTNNFNTLLRLYRKRFQAGSGSSLQDEARVRALQDEARVQALQDLFDGTEIGSEDRVIFSLTYKDVDDYHFSRDYTFTVADPDTGEDVEVTRTATVDLDRSSEMRGKVIWTRFIQFRPETPKLPNPADPDFWDKAIPKDQRPRLSVSFEGVKFNSADLQDQLIGKISYSMPVSGGMSVPVTLTWANRSELIKDQDNLFSAHVGISYKLNPGGD